MNPFKVLELFIILFLHQTTTGRLCAVHLQRLFIILFLHQTTTVATLALGVVGCLSSCSYIKPQQLEVLRRGVEVVYHLVPTSNHNL